MTNTIVRGDWFALAPDYHLALFTANAIVTADGRLVMGAGLARQIRDRCPGIDRLLGAAVRTGERPDGYGLAVVGRYERPLRTVTGAVVSIGAFQVKRDWRDRASIDLIARSISALNRYLAQRPRPTQLPRHRLRRAGPGHGRPPARGAGRPGHRLLPLETPGNRKAARVRRPFGNGMKVGR